MSVKNNYIIVSLYSTVFIIIAIITVYFPLWLKTSLGFDTNEIGFLLSSIGIIKFFSNFLIISKIKNVNYLKIAMSTLAILVILLFIIIVSFQPLLSKHNGNKYFK